MFTIAAVKISPQSFAAESVLVPLLVESIRVFPPILLRVYSRGEFPPSKPSMGSPSCSPPRMIFSGPWRSRSFSASSSAVSGEAHGYIAEHPFSRMAAMFVVALNISITTHTMFRVFSPCARCASMSLMGISGWENATSHQVFLLTRAIPKRCPNRKNHDLARIRELPPVFVDRLIVLGRVLSKGYPDLSCHRLPETSRPP